MGTIKKNEAQPATYKLSRPFTFEGETYESFPFELDELTGEDLLSCERMMNAITNEVVFSRALSMPYQLAVASKVAKVPPEVLRKMPAKDFNHMMQKVQNFFLL